jgi:hypothetical protein
MTRLGLALAAVAALWASAALAAPPAGPPLPAGEADAANLILAANAPPPRLKPVRKPDIEHAGVRLKAVLAEGVPLTDAALSWRIEPLAGGETVASSLPAPAFELTPGRYRAHLAAGLASAASEFEVAPDQIVELTVDLAAGRLTLTAQPGDGFMPLDQARFQVWRQEDSATESAAPPIATVASGTADLLLPAGAYRIEAALGLVKTARIVELKAGATAAASFDLEVGFIGVEAQAAEGTEPLQTATFTLYRHLAGASEAEPEELAQRYGRPAVFAVPAGEYRLAADFGHARSERLVTVVANTFTPVAMTLEAARLAVEVLGPEPAQRGEALAAVRLARLGQGGAAEPVADILAARPELRLAAGRYRVEAERNGARDSRIVELAAGSLQASRLVLNAGSFALDIVTPDGVEPEDPAIELAARPLGAPGQAGPPIRLGVPTEGRYRLPAGHYRLEATIRPGLARAETDLRVTAGGTTTARLAFDFGRAELKLLAKAGGLPVAAAAWRLEGAAAAAPIRLAGGEIGLALAPGTYALRAETGEGTATGEVVVVSGQTARLSLVAE